MPQPRAMRQTHVKWSAACAIPPSRSKRTKNNAKPGDDSIEPVFGVWTGASLADRHNLPELFVAASRKQLDDRVVGVRLVGRGEDEVVLAGRNAERLDFPAEYPALVRFLPRHRPQYERLAVGVALPWDADRAATLGVDDQKAIPSPPDWPGLSWYSRCPTIEVPSIWNAAVRFSGMRATPAPRSLRAPPSTKRYSSLRIKPG
jgi:hypothetical protein